MTSIEIQDFVHIYSLFSFRNGNTLPGILVSKYNPVLMQVDYHFIAHEDMHAFKAAFEKYDCETCNRLSKKIYIDDVTGIRQVLLADYKIIMQLMQERKQMQNMNR